MGLDLSVQHVFTLPSLQTVACRKELPTYLILLTCIVQQLIIVTHEQEIVQASDVTFNTQCDVIVELHRYRHSKSLLSPLGDPLEDRTIAAILGVKFYFEDPPAPLQLPSAVSSSAVFPRQGLAAPE